MSISGAYKNRLEAVVDEIIETNANGYKPPLNNFDGFNIDKCYKMPRF